MKTLTLKYRKMAKGYLSSQIEAAAQGKGLLEEDTIYFNDLGLLSKVLNETRQDILTLIKTEKPESVYELAQIMDKDQGYISREIKFLKEFGLIDLLTTKAEGRVKLKPILKYDRIVFDVNVQATPQSKQRAGSA